MITFGIDTHKGTLAVSAVDDTGREVAARTFPNTVRGHGALVSWAEAMGQERCFGIEGSGSYGAALARRLVSAGERVVEVPSTLTARGAPLAATCRQERRRGCPRHRACSAA